MSRHALDSAEAAYVAALKAVVDAADAADAPLHAQIAALRAQLSESRDPTVARARHRYRQMSARAAPGAPN